MITLIKESNGDLEVIKRYSVSYIEGDDPYDEYAEVYDDGAGFSIVYDSNTGLYGWESDAMDYSSDVFFSSAEDAYEDAVSSHDSGNGILMIDGQPVGDFDEPDEDNEEDDEEDVKYTSNTIVTKDVLQLKQHGFSDTGSVTVVDKEKCPKTLEIPYRMNGFRVTDVSLARCTNLRTLIVKAEVRDLYHNDFVGCRNLEAIVWDTWNSCFFKPDTFKDCPKLVFYVDDDHSSIIKCCNRAGIPVKSLEDAKELVIYESLTRKNRRRRRR